MEEDLMKQASVLSANARKEREGQFRERMLRYQQRVAELRMSLPRGQTLIATAEATEAPAEPKPANVFVQVGAFGEAENARRRFAMLRDVGIEPAFVHRDDSTTPAMYRVRIGPIVDVLQYDSIVERLLRLGIADTHLVTD